MPDEKENKPIITELSDSIYRQYMDRIRELNKEAEKGMFYGKSVSIPYLSSDTTKSNFHFSTVSMDLADASWPPMKMVLVMEDDPHMNHLFHSQGSGPYTSYCGKSFSAPHPTRHKGECPACCEEWFKSKGKKFNWVWP